MPRRPGPVLAPGTAAAAGPSTAALPGDRPPTRGKPDLAALKAERAERQARAAALKRERAAAAEGLDANKKGKGKAKDGPANARPSKGKGKAREQDGHQAVSYSSDSATSESESGSESESEAEVEVEDAQAPAPQPPNPPLPQPPPAAGPSRKKRPPSTSNASSKAKPNVGKSPAANGNTSDSYSDVSDSSSSDGKGHSDSEDDEAAAALEMDGQQLWAQNYCAVCEKLIPPGQGVTASGAVLGNFPGSGSASAPGSFPFAGAGSAPSAVADVDTVKLKKAIADAARTIRRPGSGGPAGANRTSATTGAAAAVAPPLRRTGSAGSRMNKLSELRPMRPPNAPEPVARNHTRTPSGGSFKRRATSRDSSLSNGSRGAGNVNGRKSPGMSRVNSLKGKQKDGAGDDALDSCSPVSPRSGIATPPGTGSGIVRSQEEAKRNRKLAKSGSGILGPLTPLMLKEQEEFEAANARAAPAALYCSVQCREMDEQRSKQLSMSGINPYYLQHSDSSEQFVRPPSVGPVNPAPGSAAASFIGPGTPSGWSLTGGLGSFGAAASGAIHSGSFAGPVPNWAQMPYGPGFSSSAGDRAPQSGSWAANRASSGVYAPGTSWSRVGSQNGSYSNAAYGYYGYPPAVITPDVNDCDCSECHAAMAAAGRVSTGPAAPTAPDAGKMEVPDNVSAVPSGASDTTESSGGYPYGPNAARAKKRTESGRVETPLNLQPGQATSGDYFSGHHNPHHHQQREREAQHHQTQQGRRSSPGLVGIGSASTNATEDSTLSYWETKRRSRPSKRAETPAEASAGPQITVRASADDLACDEGQLQRSASLAVSPSRGSSSAMLMSSPLRLLKKSSSSISGATSSSIDAYPGQGAQPSTSFNNASGFLSRSLASEHTELGTSATTTATFNPQRIGTIRRAHRDGHSTETDPVPEEQAVRASTLQGPASVQARHDQDSVSHGSFTPASYRSERLDGSLSSAISSLRLAQARDYVPRNPSRTSLSGMWATPSSSARNRSASREGPGHRRSASTEVASTSIGSTGASWWKSLVPAWSSIKALQALSNSADSEDEGEQQRNDQFQAPDVVRPSARRAEIPAFATEIGKGDVPGDEMGQDPSLAISPPTAEEDKEEVQRRRREERERAHKHQRSKESHMLPPLLAPSHLNTNLRLANPRASRAGSTSGGRISQAGISSPLYGSFGATRSTTPGPTAGGVYGHYRSTTPAGMPPSPNLRAARSSGRGSFTNLSALGDPVMRPPSRTGSAMSMHVGSLSASPRRAGLGWGPFAQPPMFNEGYAYGRGGPTVAHPHGPPHQYRHHHHIAHQHGHHHHHQHHHSVHEIHHKSASNDSDDESADAHGQPLSRPGSAIGHQRMLVGSRPRSMYGSFGQHPTDAIRPSPSSTHLTRAMSNEPTRTWSYERMPGVKTYAVMQLPGRKPTHDIYDSGVAGWNDILPSNAVTEDPAEEAKADGAEAATDGQAHRKRLFYFDA